MTSENLYVAIIGDIINSKKIENRQQVQDKLAAVLEEINNKYEDIIASKFMITLGDEFQGLLKKSEDFVNIINQIELDMFPIIIRFGVGIGEITTNINPDIPLGADGPAYYNARNMIDSLKVLEKRAKAFSTNIMLHSNNAINDELLNTIFSLTTAIKYRWTERQREIIKLCLTNGDNQTKVAKIAGVNQPTIHKLLSNANYYTFKNAINTISKSLADEDDRYV